MSEVESRKFNELSEEFVMDSVQLCETINKYRLEENRKRAELKHYDLFKSIEKEIEYLKNAGIEGDGNFSVSSYVSSQNKKLPCYALTKFGAMQILNKESAYVRYKTQEYIEELEFRNSVLEVPYNEMAEDRLINGFNYKEAMSYLETYDLDDLNEIKSLSESFKRLGFYPYTAYVKKYFDPTNFKLMDKLINSTDFKEHVKTLTTTEFVDLLETNAVTYTSKSGKIQIEEFIVSKGKIKVISEKALVHLALTLNNSEVAKDFRQFLLNSQLIELQQVNQITNEKDIKAIYELQQQVNTMLTRLEEREDRLNEREKLLNQREANVVQKETILNNYTVENKGKMKLRDRVKKAFKILFGGDGYSSSEIIITKHEFESPKEEVEVDKVIEQIKEIEIVGVDEEPKHKVEFNPYPSPKETRKPIAKESPGYIVKAPSNPMEKAVARQKEEQTRINLIDDFKKKVNYVSKVEGQDIKYIYGDVYRKIENRFHITIPSSQRTSKVKSLKASHLRYGIQYLKDTYSYLK